MDLINGGFEAELRRSGLGVKEAAAELGYSPRHIKRVIAGEIPVPKLVTERVNDLAAGRLQAMPTPRFRFIDLFAGIGGLRLGFEAIGGKCVFTSEWDRWSQQTYARNFADGDDHMM